MATDEEQIEELKKWWSEKGKVVVAGVAIGLAGVIGWTSWQSHLRTEAERASVRYQQLVSDALIGDAAAENDPARTLAQAGALIDEFPDSAYASLASLIAARAAVAANAPDEARRHLRWVVEHAPFPELIPIARLRLARLMLDAKEYDAALAELDGVGAAPFRARVAELRGDVQRARGDHAAARQSYDAALAGGALSRTARVRLRMKLDDLGELASPPPSS